MSTVAMVFFEGRVEDRVVVGLALILCYLILFPGYVLFTRAISKNRIRKQIVTSQYKLPIRLSPSEFSYIFSSKIDKKHILATILDLANRSLLIVDQREGKLFVSPGPRIDDKLSDYENLVMEKVAENSRQNIESFTDGKSSFKSLNKGKIEGSRVYVFWWVMRNQMQKDGIINSNMKLKYLKMLFTNGVLISYLITVISVISVTFVRMSREGEIEARQVFESLVDISCFLFLLMIPILIITFFLLKMRGKNLGRYWLIKQKNIRYLPQIVAYREFVVLAHKNKLKFESTQLKTKSLAETRPYAVALGITKI